MPPSMMCKLASPVGGATPIIPMMRSGMAAPFAPDSKGAPPQASRQVSRRRDGQRVGSWHSATSRRDSGKSAYEVKIKRFTAT